MVICPYCMGLANMISSLDYYGNDYGNNVWECRKCSATVGTLKGSRKPLGTLANKELRDLRIECHERYDFLLKSNRFSEARARSLLAAYMRLPIEEFKIGSFREGNCIRFLEIMDKHGL